jgi:hypothetical protein
LSDFGITVKIDELLLNGDGGRFGLPEIQDWPLCGVWDREQLTSQQDRFSSIDITDERLQALAEADDEKEMAYDSIRQIKENVAYCLEKQLGMITFCH